MADNDIQKISKINGAILVDEVAQYKIKEINEKFNKGGEYKELQERVEEDLSELNKLKTDLQNTSIGIKKDFIYNVVKKINNCIDLMYTKFGDKFSLERIEISDLDNITDAEVLTEFLKQAQDSINKLFDFIYNFYPESGEGFVYRTEEGSVQQKKIINGSDPILQEVFINDINFETIDDKIPTVSAMNGIINFRIEGDLKNKLESLVISVNEKINALEDEIARLDSLYIDSLITFYNAENSLDNYNNILTADLNLGVITDQKIKKDSFVIFNNSTDNITFTYTDIIKNTDTLDQIAAKTHSFILSPRQFKKFIKFKKESEGETSYYLEEMFRDGIVEPSEAEGQSFINDETISKKTVWSSDKVNKFVEGAGNTLSWTGTKEEWEEYIKNNYDKLKEGQQVNITNDDGTQSLEIINDEVISNRSTWSSKKISDYRFDFKEKGELVFEKTNPNGEEGELTLPTGLYLVEVCGGAGGAGGTGGAGGGIGGGGAAGGTGGNGTSGFCNKKIMFINQHYKCKYIIGGTGGDGGVGGVGGDGDGGAGGAGGTGGADGAGSAGIQDFGRSIAFKIFGLQITATNYYKFFYRETSGAAGAGQYDGGGGGAGGAGGAGGTTLFTTTFDTIYGFGGIGGLGGTGGAGQYDGGAGGYYTTYTKLLQLPSGAKYEPINSSIHSYNNFLVELAKLNCINLSETFDIPSSTIRIYKLS